MAGLLSFPGVSGGQSIPATAVAEAREGMVIRVDGDDLLVDLGHGTGVGAGSTYRIYRPITVRHPVTGHTLHDRFPFGTVAIASAGVSMSIAHGVERLDRPPLVGDILVPIGVEPVEPPVPRQPHPIRNAPTITPTEHPTPEATFAPTPEARFAPPLQPAPSVQHLEGAMDPESQAALDVWRATLGQPPETRITLYERFLQGHPASRYASRIRDEIGGFARLTTWIREHTVDTTAPRAPALIDPGLNLRSNSPAVLERYDHPMMTFQLARDANVAGAVFHVRERGALSYVSMALAVEGDGYLRVWVPQALVTPPGFDWFLELVDAQGRAHAVSGTSAVPNEVDVEAPPRAIEPEPGRSRMDLRGEYADVGSQPGHPEHFTLVEGDFLQRVHSGVLYGYRVGFGVYDGIGQSLAAYGGSTPAMESTVVYGYHELEFELTDFVHVMGRVEIGVDGGGVVGGFQARLRIGHERATNIVLGGDIFNDVGQRAFFRFNFFPLERLPMTAEGEVFNQSIDGGDPMFRFIYQGGYRFLPWLVLSARVSYQLRNLSHDGFGGGAAVTFDW